MSYVIEITETASFEIKKKIDKHLRDRLEKKVQKLENDPKIYGKPLRYPLAGIWEIYFEKRYRILYMINEENKIVRIVGLKHKDEMQKLATI